METNQSSYLPNFLSWDSAMNLIENLYCEKEFRLSIIVGFGFICGLEIEDIRLLTWKQIINKRDFIIYEIQTGKKRQIRISKKLYELIERVHSALEINDNSEPCFLGENREIITSCELNNKLMSIKNRYGIPVSNFDAQTLRITFGRRIVENAGNQPEMAIEILRNIFGQPSKTATKEYLGLPINETSDLIAYNIT